MPDPICLLPLVVFLIVLSIGCFITDYIPTIVRCIARRSRLSYMRKLQKKKLQIHS